MLSTHVMNNTNFHSYSDRKLAAMIGDFVKHHRLQLNKSQHTLAAEAGISRSTLSLLERGETVTLITLLQVLRALDQLQLLLSFIIEERISPLALAKAQQQKRTRSRKRKDINTNSDW